MCSLSYVYVPDEQRKRVQQHHEHYTQPLEALFLPCIKMMIDEYNVFLPKRLRKNVLQLELARIPLAKTGTSDNIESDDVFEARMNRQHRYEAITLIKKDKWILSETHTEAFIHKTEAHLGHTLTYQAVCQIAESDPFFCKDVRNVHVVPCLSKVVLERTWTWR